MTDPGLSYVECILDLIPVSLTTIESTGMSTGNSVDENLGTADRRCAEFRIQFGIQYRRRRLQVSILNNVGTADLR